MKITRRAFIKGSITLGGVLVVPDRMLQAAAVKANQWSPAYKILATRGILNQRVEQAYAIFEECRLCPRQCGVNRLPQRQPGHPTHLMPNILNATRIR